MNDEERSFEEQLTRGWHALSPPANLKERVREHLADGADGSRGNGEDSPSSQTSRWSALKASGSLGVASGGLLLALGFVAGSFFRTEIESVPTIRSIDPSLAPTVMPAPGHLEPTGPVNPAAVEMRAPAAEGGAPTALSGAALPPGSIAASSPNAPSTSGASKQRASAPAGGALARAVNPLARQDEELALIVRAERALRARNAALALALSAELDERHPGTTLHEERHAIALMARCQSEAADSPAERERFERRYPTSVYGARVREECGFDAGTPPLLPPE